MNRFILPKEWFNNFMNSDDKNEKNITSIRNSVFLNPKKNKLKKNFDLEKIVIVVYEIMENIIDLDYDIDYLIIINYDSKNDFFDFSDITIIDPRQFNQIDPAYEQIAIDKGYFEPHNLKNNINICESTLELLNTKEDKKDEPNIRRIKSGIIEYDKNNNQKNLFNKYSNFSKDLIQKEKDNSKINPIISFNKVTESNKIDKLDNDFNAIYNMVESKIRQNKIDIKINEANQRYYNSNNKFNKLIPKLLSISQNEPMSNYLYNYSNRNNMFSNHFKSLYKNNLNTQINQEVMKPYIKDNKPRFNNYIISDFSIYQNN